MCAVFRSEGGMAPCKSSVHFASTRSSRPADLQTCNVQLRGEGEVKNAVKRLCQGLRSANNGSWYSNCLPLARTTRHVTAGEASWVMNSTPARKAKQSSRAALQKRVAGARHPSFLHPDGGSQDAAGVTGSLLHVSRQSMCRD